ncbi:MAG: transglycosylase SLT domain-containing protein [Planctomycetota bacterium]
MRYDRLGLPKPAKDDLLHNDELNVRLAANHLRWLLDHRGEWDTEAVLVSYNAGRSKLKRWAGEHGDYAGWVRSEEQAAEKGEKTTGALAYARRTLRVAGRCAAARSKIRAEPPPETGSPLPSRNRIGRVRILATMSRIRRPPGQDSPSIRPGLGFSLLSV